MRVTALILLALAALSCSPAFKLRKAKRLIAEAIAQGARVDLDTIYVDKEVIVPGEILKVPYAVPGPARDTTIYVDRWHPGKGSIRIKHDSIFVQCPPDTVRVEIPTVITRHISAGVSDWWKPVAIGALLVAGLLAFAFVRKGQ